MLYSQIIQSNIFWYCMVKSVISKKVNIKCFVNFRHEFHHCPDVPLFLHTNWNTSAHELHRRKFRCRSLLMSCGSLVCDVDSSDVLWTKDFVLQHSLLFRIFKFSDLSVWDQAELHKLGWLVEIEEVTITHLYNTQRSSSVNKFQRPKKADWTEYFGTAQCSFNLAMKIVYLLYRGVSRRTKFLHNGLHLAVTFQVTHYSKAHYSIFVLWYTRVRPQS